MTKTQEVMFERWLERWCKETGQAFSRSQLEDAFVAGMNVLKIPKDDMIVQMDVDLANQFERDTREVIQRWHVQQQSAFEARHERYRKGLQPYTEDELYFSRDKRCDCGYGLAYPNSCGPGHEWDCAGILMGVADPTYTHTAVLPFAFYDIKGENDEMTTRGSVLPNPNAPRKPAPTNDEGTT